MSERTDTSVIVAGARTPIGRLLGGLKDLSAADLGGVAIKRRAGEGRRLRRPGRLRDHGPGHQAGAGQNPARTAAVAGGIPMNVPAITINKVCLSGINAIALADQLIRAGEFDIVVAGGMESMTQAPHLLPKSREGFKYGDTTLVDSMAYDALYDQVTDQADGRPDRAVQRRRAPTSPARSRTRSPPGPTSGPPRRGRTASSTTRSCRSRSRSARATRSSSAPTRASAATPPSESLGKLRPAFSKDGTITAGSASQISDGACRRRRDEQGEGRGARA